VRDTPNQPRDSLRIEANTFTNVLYNLPMPNATSTGDSHCNVRVAVEHPIF
jgi:hypothetical protein